MDKSRLKVDDLRIESFATASAEAGPQGTVHGHATRGDDVTCDASPECVVTGDSTCIEPCGTALGGPETSVTCPCDTVDVC